MPLHMTTVHTVDRNRLTVPELLCAFCHVPIVLQGSVLWDHDQQPLFLHRRCEDRWRSKFPAHYRDADLETVLKELLANFLNPLP